MCYILQVNHFLQFVVHAEIWLKSFIKKHNSMEAGTLLQDENIYGSIVKMGCDVHKYLQMAAVFVCEISSCSGNSSLNP